MALKISVKFIVYFRILYKTLASSFFIILFFTLALIVHIFLYPFDFTKKKLLIKLSRLSSKIILKIISFHLVLKGVPPPNNGTLIIGNHMSYLDILIYLSCFECLFVSSVETKERFFLGQITSLAGCLFVERRNPKNLLNELRAIKKYVDQNLSICIFPEGTSSNGEKILPFKKSLFQLPIETKCPIQPIILKYLLIDNKPFSLKNCDLVCWYGEHQPFLNHILTLFSLKKITAQIEILTQIDSNNFDNRKKIAESCHKILSDRYSQK